MAELTRQRSVASIGPIGIVGQSSFLAKAQAAEDAARRLRDFRGKYMQHVKENLTNEKALIMEETGLYAQEKLNEIFLDNKDDPEAYRARASEFIGQLSEGVDPQISREMDIVFREMMAQHSYNARVGQIAEFERLERANHLNTAAALVEDYKSQLADMLRTNERDPAGIESFGTAALEGYEEALGALPEEIANATRIDLATSLRTTVDTAATNQHNQQVNAAVTRTELRMQEQVASLSQLAMQNPNMPDEDLWNVWDSQIAPGVMMIGGVLDDGGAGAEAMLRAGIVPFLAAMIGRRAVEAVRDANDRNAGLDLINDFRLTGEGTGRDLSQYGFAPAGAVISTAANYAANQINTVFPAPNTSNTVEHYANRNVLEAWAAGSQHGMSVTMPNGQSFDVNPMMLAKLHSDGAFGKGDAEWENLREKVMAAYYLSTEAINAIGMGRPLDLSNEYIQRIPANQLQAAIDLAIERANVEMGWSMETALSDPHIIERIAVSSLATEHMNPLLPELYEFGMNIDFATDNEEIQARDAAVLDALVTNYARIRFEGNGIENGHVYAFLENEIGDAALLQYKELSKDINPSNLAGTNNTQGEEAYARLSIAHQIDLNEASRNAVQEFTDLGQEKVYAAVNEDAYMADFTNSTLGQLINSTRNSISDWLSWHSDIGWVSLVSPAPHHPEGPISFWGDGTRDPNESALATTFSIFDRTVTRATVGLLSALYGPEAAEPYMPELPLPPAHTDIGERVWLEAQAIVAKHPNISPETALEDAVAVVMAAGYGPDPLSMESLNMYRDNRLHERENIGGDLAWSKNPFFTVEGVSGLTAALMTVEITLRRLGVSDSITAHRLLNDNRLAIEWNEEKSRLTGHNEWSIYLKNDRGDWISFGGLPIAPVSSTIEATDRQRIEELTYRVLDAMEEEFGEEDLTGSQTHTLAAQQIASALYSWDRLGGFRGTGTGEGISDLILGDKPSQLYDYFAEFNSDIVMSEDEIIMNFGEYLDPNAPPPEEIEIPIDTRNQAYDRLTPFGAKSSETQTDESLRGPALDIDAAEQEFYND